MEVCFPGDSTPVPPPPRRVVSGSRDATLRVWDIETGQCLHVLMGHVAAVRCVQYDGRRVVSGAYDFMVKVWDPETETCLHTLQGHTNRVYSLQVSSTPQTIHYIHRIHQLDLLFTGEQYTPNYSLQTLNTPTGSTLYS